MDRQETLDALKALAFKVRAKGGSENDFANAAAEINSPAQVGSSDVLDIWRRVVGLDTKTGRPVA